MVGAYPLTGLEDMMKRFALIVCLAVFAAGCGGGRLVVDRTPGKSINPAGQLSLVCLVRDVDFLQDSLEHRFLKAGFNVRSEVPGEFERRVRQVDRNAMSGRASYLFEYSYYARRTFIMNRYVIESFSAALKGAGGEKILRMNFRGSRSASSLMDEVVDRTSELLDREARR